jgi:uncharacterized membrane protein (DUF485 family)
MGSAAREQALIRSRAASQRNRLRRLNREDNPMDPQRLSRVSNDPRFRELIARRSRFAWTLTVVMLAIYYGFILIVAFAPSVLGIPIAPGAVTTIGIPVGILIIIAAFVLTGLYVRRANSEFDALNQQIVEGSQ